jgi:succinate dehydrogenase / fumarate reductase cytochrome b subunit
MPCFIPHNWNERGIERMSSLVQMFQSTLGRKYAMGLTGLALVLFTLSHMAGNLLLFVNDGGDAYNIYSHTLVSNPAIYGIEAVLALIFLGHIVNAFILYFRNSAARPEAYSMGTNGEKAVSLSSLFMLQTGMLLLVFLVIHLMHFKFGFWGGLDYKSMVHGTEMRDLHKLVVQDSFSSPTSPWLWGYLAAMVLLFVHLKHGAQSFFQSLGLMGQQTRQTAETIGFLLSLAISIGFALPPIYLAFIKHGTATVSGTH